MIKQRIMYVCSECAEGCPEACGHYDRTELRVMPDGAWLCESCFDNNDDNEFLSWGHLPAPEEYGRIPASAQCAPDQEALQAAWAEGYEFGLNSRDKTPGAAALRALVIEECAKVCEDLRHDDYSAETSDWSGGTFDCARAIRALALSEGMRQSPALNDVLESCKIEHKKFEEWAAAQKYDMHEHPLHYLFLDAKTNAARQGWKAALRYVAEATSLSSTQSLRQEG